MCLRHSGIHRSILMNNLHTYIYKGLTQNEYSSGPHSHRQTHSCILTLHEILKLTLISKTLSQTKISIMYKVFRIEQVFPSTQIDSSSTLNIYVFSYILYGEWVVCNHYTTTMENLSHIWNQYFTNYEIFKAEVFRWPNSDAFTSDQIIIKNL